MSLDKLSTELKQKITGKNLPADVIDTIKDWPVNLIEQIFSFKLGYNKTIQVINLLKDISLRDNQSIDAPLIFPEWLTIYNNTKIPSYQKGLLLRQFLLGIRYPAYTDLRNKIKRAINKLNLPKNISLIQDELLTLEKESISFKIECKTTEDLKNAAKKLAEISDSKEIEALLNLLKM